ncbi:hypothetical protein [Luteimonas terrae]|uniref:hypothetical protein n=1 Tax=Luteimonas terrae TaxID=1530191 RepID=UPI00286CEC20|nr:hypothetical protein [Luteimonas terrae]
MPTPLIPQEIYLLERYSSFEYFAPIRDQWQAMVDHVEQCLEVFMAHLPPDYRSRQQPYQPDIVWGERVLPNFRSTLQLLDRACINLYRGDLKALGAALGVTGGHRGQVEYWAGWMASRTSRRSFPTRRKSITTCSVPHSSVLGTCSIVFSAPGPPGNCPPATAQRTTARLTHPNAGHATGSIRR